MKYTASLWWIPVVVCTLFALTFLLDAASTLLDKLQVYRFGKWFIWVLTTLWLAVTISLYVRSRTLFATPTIDLLNISVLNTDLNSTNTWSIAFYLLLRNSNSGSGVSFFNTSVTFYDSPNRSQFLGNYTFPAFHLGAQKHTVKTGLLQPDVIPASSNFTVVLRIDMAAQIKKGSKRKNVAVGADIPITDKGTIDTHEGIRLTPKGMKKI